MQLILVFIKKKLNLHFFRILAHCETEEKESD